VAQEIAHLAVGKMRDGRRYEILVFAPVGSNTKVAIACVAICDTKSRF